MDPSGSFVTQDFSLFLYMVMANTDKKRARNRSWSYEEEQALIQLWPTYTVFISQVQQIPKDKTRLRSAATTDSSSISILIYRYIFRVVSMYKPKKSNKQTNK